jgi:hypothetical protein
MALEELHENPLIIDLHERITPLLNKYKVDVDNDGKKVFREVSKLSPDEKYLLKFFNLNNNLLNSCDHLKYVIVFLKRFPHRKFYGKNSILEADYIQYHLEMFEHKLFTIFEILKLITNHVYQLKMPIRSCNLKSLIKYLGEQNLTITVLSEIDKQLLYWRKHRNYFVHQGEFIKDSKFDFLKTAEYYSFIAEKYKVEYDTNLIPGIVIKFSLKGFKKKRIKECDDNCSGIIQFIDSFYFLIAKDLHENRIKLSYT